MNSAPGHRAIPRYRSASEVNPGGAATVVAAGGSAGIIAGLIASLFAYHDLYLVVWFPLLMGLSVATVTSAAARFSGTHNVFVAGLTAMISGLVTVTAMHYGDYLFFLSDSASEVPDQRQPVASFIDFMNMQSGEGVSFSVGKYGASVELGRQATVIYWAVEACIVAGMVIVFTCRQAQKPFCSRCRKWHEEFVIGTATMPVAEAMEAIESANFQAIKTGRNRQEVADLSLFRCPQCGSENQTVVAVTSNVVVECETIEEIEGYFELTDLDLANLLAVFGVSDNATLILNEVHEMDSELQAAAATSLPTPGVNNEASDYVANLLQQQGNATSID
ncbi:MAG: hypothetical protein ACR2NP_00750 [Pirellulaceae bacterium]